MCDGSSVRKDLCSTPSSPKYKTALRAGASRSFGSSDPRPDPRRQIANVSA